MIQAPQRCPSKFIIMILARLRKTFLKLWDLYQFTSESIKQDACTTTSEDKEVRQIELKFRMECRKQIPVLIPTEALQLTLEIHMLQHWILL